MKKYYTNQQLYTMLKPDQMDSPYIYDNFEWTHCDVSQPISQIPVFVFSCPT